VGSSAGTAWPGGPRSGSSAGWCWRPPGATAAQQWRRQAGGKAAGALTVAYVAAFAGSHPLAKKVGAWPSVFGVAGAVALASWAVSDRRA
jgi:hypothetical protein